MCQITVLIEKEGQQEKVGEGVTSLEVSDQGIVLNTFFDEPQLVVDVAIKRIDFLGGKVILQPLRIF